MKDRPRKQKHRDTEAVEQRWQEATKCDETGTIRRWLNLAKEMFDKDNNDPEPNAA